MIKERVLYHNYLLVTKEQRDALDHLRNNLENEFKLSEFILDNWQNWSKSDDPDNPYNCLGQINIKYLIPAAIANRYTSKVDVFDIIKYMLEDASSFESEEAIILKKILNQIDLYDTEKGEVL